MAANKRNRITLTQAIARSGLTRAEVAKRLGVSPSIVTLWAQDRRIMLEQVAVALAFVLGVDRAQIKLKTRKGFQCLMEETGSRRRA